jgi:hypothetical protein
MRYNHMLAAIGVLALMSTPAIAVTATFDSVNASPDFGGTAPGGAAGPTVTEAGITFNGGVILNGADFANEETTTPNLYATTDLYPLSDGSSLPGVITGSLSGFANSISLDVANGFSASTFTLNLFNSGSLIGSSSINLGGYGTGSAVGALAFSGSLFNSFQVVSGQGAGSIDFGIDTVSIPAAVPEPASWALMIGGMGVVGAAMRRRKLATIGFAKALAA